jgi:hypothetical protein
MTTLPGVMSGSNILFQDFPWTLESYLAEGQNFQREVQIADYSGQLWRLISYWRRLIYKAQYSTIFTTDPNTLPLLEDIAAPVPPAVEPVLETMARDWVKNGYEITFDRMKHEYTLSVSYYAFSKVSTAKYLYEPYDDTTA